VDWGVVLDALLVFAAVAVGSIVVLALVALWLVP
jgi:hypothetical protein